MPKPVYITETTFRYLTPRETRALPRPRGARPRLNALWNRATADGFKPVKGPEAAWGFAASWKASDGATEVSEATVESLAKPGTKDAGAVLTVTVRSKGKSATYEAYLVAPNGRFDKPKEYYATDAGQVRPANSFWSAFKACVRSRNCGTACLSALVTCIPSAKTWVAYFICFGAACGGCLGKCFACAACDCSWWCKWASGCCHR